MAEPTVIAPPAPSGRPDSATKKAVKDMTAATADHRVLFVNFGLFKYGTNDKGHAAAIVFSFLLLIIISAVIFIGMWVKQPTWDGKVFNWLGSTFLIVVGVAIGKSTNPDTKNNDSD